MRYPTLHGRPNGGVCSKYINQQSNHVLSRCYFYYNGIETCSVRFNKVNEVTKPKVAIFVEEQMLNTRKDDGLLNINED